MSASGDLAPMSLQPIRALEISKGRVAFLLERGGKNGHIFFFLDGYEQMGSFALDLEDLKDSFTCC